MANAAENRGIKQSWSLLAFARMKGLPQTNHGRNSETGEEFDNLVFVDKDNNFTFVGYSRNLGVLTEEQLIARKHELQVAELNPDENGKPGGYVLCKSGNMNLGGVIDLFD